MIENLLDHDQVTAAQDIKSWLDKEDALTADRDTYTAFFSYYIRKNQPTKAVYWLSQFPGGLRSASIHNYFFSFEISFWNGHTQLRGQTCI